MAIIAHLPRLAATLDRHVVLPVLPALTVRLVLV